MSFRDSDVRLLSDTRWIPCRNELSPVDVQRQWYSPSDFSTFRATSKFIAAQASQSGLNDLLEDSFPSNLSAEDPLLKWSRYAHLRRGLEQSVSARHGAERRSIKKESIRVVVSTQRLLRSNGVAIEEINLNIAKGYASCTIDAILFAQRMGKADADAILVRTRPEVPSPGILRSNRNALVESFKMNSSDSSIRCASILTIVDRRRRAESIPS